MLTFMNPATGTEFGHIETIEPGDAQQTVQAMRRAFAVWSAKPVAERVRALRRLQAVILDSLDEITATINQDCGKSRQDALLEVFMTVDMLNDYCHNAPRWLKPRSVSRGLYLFKQCHVEYRPHGVVLVIAPWNYPFALSMPPVIAALLAGNTVILKPSEVTAATGVMMEGLLKRVPELADYVRVAHGDGAVGAALVQAAPDYIFLTGSTTTGKRVAAAAAEHLIPVGYELGGKDAMIVLEDADVAAAARWGAWGAYFNAGQTCMAVERCYVVEAVYDEFVARAVAETEKIKVGFTTEEESPYYLGPITDPRQLDIIRSHLADALAKGARILTGGQIDGMYVQPTVMVDVDHSMLLMRDETFGPILPIVKVRDEAEAIRLANDSHFGLGASIWSRDLARAQRVAGRVQAASVVINDTIAQFAVPQLPFGGIKQSGTGRTHGQEGLMQFTRSYSYAVGQAPLAWDVATILREPGHYKVGAALMRLVFGVDMRQRLQPFKAVIEARVGRPLTSRDVALGVGAVAVAGAWVGRGRRGHRSKPRGAEE